MRLQLFVFTGVMFMIFWGGKNQIAAGQEAAARNRIVRFTFDELHGGVLPAGWKGQATNRRGPLATWKVTKDSSAPSGNKVLSLVKVNHTFGGTFNLCWTDRVHFLNGEIAVKFRANSGLEDQGGGVIWRVRDKDNYYICRYNPLEKNFRIYYVKDGARRMLASARIQLPAHQWHGLKITMNGDQMAGYLNGKKLLEVKDHTFPEAGGVGLWTKADAATSFDDFEIHLQK